MTYNSVLYTDTATTYIQVVPSGLVIVALDGSQGSGTYEIAIGTSQVLTLDPVGYSYDIDSLASMANLKFTYYCKVIDNAVEYDYPQLYYANYLDLLTMQNNYASNLNIQQFFNSNNTHSCFNSIGYIINTYIDKSKTPSDLFFCL